MEALKSENEALKTSLEELQDSKGKDKKKDNRVFLPTAPDPPYFPLPKSHSSIKPFLAPLTFPDRGVVRHPILFALVHYFCNL